MTERRLMKQDTFHKWVVTAIALSGVLWGAMAYYVKAEDAATRSGLQTQIDVLKVHQETNTRMHSIVIKIDKKLTTIEESLRHQSDLAVEVRGLRVEVTKLQIELARRQ